MLKETFLKKQNNPKQSKFVWVSLLNSPEQNIVLREGSVKKSVGISPHKGPKNTISHNQKRYFILFIKKN